MRKHALLSMVLLSSVLLPEAAQALDTRKVYRVRFDGAQVGTWRVRNRVVETHNACRYTIMWHSPKGPPLSRTTLCRIDEYKAGDDFDCEVSRRGFFDTVVQQSCGPCQGFDDFGQQTQIKVLVAGESSHGFLVGVVMTASVSDVQNLEIS